MPNVNSVNFSHSPSLFLLNNLKFLFANVDTLRNKMSELELLHDKFDVIILTEVLLKNNCIDIAEQLNSFKLKNYKMYNNADPRRGICVFVKDNLTSKVVFSESCKFQSCESCLIELVISGEKFLIGGIYRNQNVNKSVFNTYFSNIMKHLKYDNVIICGDFNLPKINWVKCSPLPIPEQEFVDLLHTNDLHQVVTFPTRFRENQINNTLDLLLISSNVKSRLNGLSGISPLGKSDHATIVFGVESSTHPIKKSCSYYDYSHADFVKINDNLNQIDWSTLNDMSLEESWSFFEDKMKQNIEDHVPLKTQKRKKPPWFNHELKELIKRKKNAFKRYMSNKATYRYKIYSTIRNLVKKKIKEAIRNHESKIINDVKANPKKFWNYINKKTKHGSQLGDLIGDDGSFCDTDLSKATTLNNHFAKAFTIEDSSNIPEPQPKNTTSSIHEILITEKCVLTNLNNLKTNKSMGPDGIPAVLLKNTAASISIPLTMIFNKSLSDGKLPKMWKLANVIPIFKKGIKTDPNNYRPISLTSICAKLMESILKDSLTIFLNDTKFLSNSQYGFRSGRSCTTQLIEVMNDFSTHFENKETVDIIYFDFKKAFDTVPHNRLLLKLKQAGIDGNVLKWVTDFLHDRKQRVVIDSASSTGINVESGVPQGSVLGPLLFLIFINDLPDNLESTCKMFADDTKLYNLSKKSSSLQSDINKLTDWSNTWQLKFNTDKCKVLHLGKNNPCNAYFMNGQQLLTVNVERDLGVTFDSSLEFKEHITKCSSDANKLIGVIKRNISYLNKDSLRILITSLIRSKLEFCNCIWSPIYKWQSSMLEKVQRRATKLLPQIKNFSYEDRLKYLNLTSLKYRRIRGDLIQTFKFLKGYDVLSKNIFSMSDNTNLRNNYLKLKTIYTKNPIRSNFLSNRITNTWNKLSTCAKESNTINQFKNFIDKELYELRFEFDK